MASSTGSAVNNLVGAVSTGTRAGALVAHASAIGHSGFSDDFSVEAESLPQGAPAGLVGAIDDLNVSVGGQQYGNVTAIADTQLRGPVAAFDSTDTGVGIAVGVPDAADTAPVLAGNPAIAQAFGAGSAIYTMGELGGGHGSESTLDTTTSSELGIKIDPATLGSGDLVLGLYGGSFFDNGSSAGGATGGSLDVVANGTILLDPSFTSGAGLMAEFTNHGIDLGNLAGLATGGTLDLSVTLGVTTDEANSGFYAGFILGGHAGSGSSPVAPPANSSAMDGLLAAMHNFQ